MHARFSLREALANSHDFQRVNDVNWFPVEKKVLNAAFKTLRQLHSQLNIQNNTRISLFV